MATLTGKITDVTGRAPDSISSIMVKAPSVRIGGSGGSSVIVSSPATVDFNRSTGNITISGLTGGLSWLYLEGDGWSDSIALAVADGMITLVEAVANASGVPGLVDYIDLLETLRQNMQDVVTDEFARNSTASVGYAANAGKNVQLDTGGKLNIVTSQVTREQDAASKGYVDQRVPITGTGSPEGKVAAPVGSIYTDSAATNGAIRWIKTSDTGNTGWQVEYGDTGLRDISNLLLNATGAVSIRRTGSTVYLNVKGVTPESTLNSGSTFLDVLPVGFRPMERRDFATMSKTQGGVSRSMFQFPTGAMGVWVPSTSDKYFFQHSWLTTNVWPTSLPGTPL